MRKISTKTVFSFVGEVIIIRRRKIGDSPPFFSPLENGDSPLFFEKLIDFRG
jgi:hypothetical protein